MKLKTSPKHWLDYVLWPFVKWFRQKKSCWWQWIPHKGSVQHYLSTVKGDPRRGSWNTVVVVYPIFSDPGTGLEQSYTGEYRVGFISSEGEVQICTVVIPPLEGNPGLVSSRPVALKVGREEVFLFAEAIGVDRPVALSVFERTTQYALWDHPKHKEVILL